jgi:hypothetical protein
LYIDDAKPAGLLEWEQLKAIIVAILEKGTASSSLLPEAKTSAYNLCLYI